MEHPISTNQELAGRARLGLDQFSSNQYLLSGMLVNFLRQEFAQNATRNLVDPRIKSLVYSTEDAVSQLEIEDVSTWKGTRTGQRPMIVVAEQDYQWQQISIDDRDNIRIAASRSGAANYCAVKAGSHVVNVIAAAGQVGLIAAQLEVDLWYFCRYVLQEESPRTFLRCRVVVSKGRQRLQGAGFNLYGIKIALEISMQARMSVFPQGRVLDKIELTASSNHS